MLPTKFQFIWQSGYRTEYYLEINQSETGIAYGGHVLLKDRDKMSNLVHMAKWFQRRRFFRNQPIRNKNWRPCLLTDRDEMSNCIEDLP